MVVTEVELTVSVPPMSCLWDWVQLWPLDGNKVLSSELFKPFIFNAGEKAASMAPLRRSGACSTHMLSDEMDLHFSRLLHSIRRRSGF